MDVVAEEGNGGLRSVCSVTFSAAEIGFAGLDERTNSLFVDKFSYSRESLFSIIESVRGGCNVGTWLIHPKHQDNPIVDFLYSSDDGGRGAAKKSVVEVVKAGVWRPEVAIDTVYKHLEVERIIVAQEENNGGLEGERQPPPTPPPPQKREVDSALSNLYIYISSIVNMRDEMVVSCLGALIFYLLEKAKVTHPGGQDFIVVKDCIGLRDKSILRIDSDTIEGLSIFSKELHPNVIHGRGASKEGLSLFTLLDRTRSKSGQHRLREWLYRPFADVPSIKYRQLGVAIMTKLEYLDLQKVLSSDMSHVHDIPQALLRIKKATATVKDWLRLLASLKACVRIIATIRGFVEEVMEDLNDQKWLSGFIETVNAQRLGEITSWLTGIVDEERTAEASSLTILEGVSAALDEKTELYDNLENYLYDAGLEILTLSPFLERAAVEYVPHLGYLVSVDHTYSAWHGTDFEFLYSDNEGNQYLRHPVTAKLDDKLGDLRSCISKETDAIMRQVEEEVLQHEGVIQGVADVMASLDVIMSLGLVSKERNFVQPEIVEQPIMAIQGGRHPLHELTLDNFIANDAYLNSQDKSCCLVTGPNSSGKSTYLKMVGCIIVLAHIGSHVPATKAIIGVADKLLVRVSSCRPQSCVEPRSEFTSDLNQICSLCRKFTPRSVCLIDDFGKSTSPVDGLALLATLIETVALSRARSIFTLPFPDLLGHDIIKRDILAQTMSCAMQSVDKNNPDGGMLVGDDRGFGGGDEGEEAKEIIPLYHLVYGISPDAGGIACARSAGVDAQTIARAELVKQCVMGGKTIPVDVLAGNRGDSILSPPIRAQLRDFLTTPN